MFFFTHKMEEATEQSLKQGIEQGIEQGRAQIHRAWSDWNTRRQEAEAKGIPFNEPPPSNPENGTRK